jgi:hypothetical protein
MTWLRRLATLAIIGSVLHYVTRKGVKVGKMLC